MLESIWEKKRSRLCDKEDQKENTMENEEGASTPLPDGQQNEPETEESGPTSLPDEQEREPEEDTLTSLSASQQSEPEEEDHPTSLPDGQESESEAAPELASVPGRKRSKYPRWFQVLAAALVIVCLAGGVFAYAQTRQSTSATPTQVKLSTPTPIQPLKITNWCVPTAAQVDPKARLTKVVAISANDAWVLGSMTTGNSFTTARTSPLLEHWNGTTWSIVPTADTTSLFNSLKSKAGVKGDADETVSLNDLAVLSVNDVWVVGDITVSQLSHFGPSQFAAWTTAEQTVVEHWDGSTWQIVDSPNPQPKNTLQDRNGVYYTFVAAPGDSLTSITAVSANDIWAVGTQGGILVNSSPLVEHWDGSHWTVVQLPATLQKGVLNEVQEISANDIWAFGTDTSALTYNVFLPTDGATYIKPNSAIRVAITKDVFVGTNTPLAAHWDGQRWDAMKLPNALSKGGLSSVAVISANNIWVVGNSYTTQGKKLVSTPVLQHWDGSQWNSVDEATGLSSGSSFAEISAIGPDNIWVIGQTKEYRPLMEHWDGKTWSLVSPTSPAYGSVTSIAVAGNKAWALVDAYNVSDVQKLSIPNFMETLLETNC